MSETRYYLTRRQIERERIYVPLIPADHWQRPAMINIEEERDIIETYSYEYDIKSMIDKRLGLNDALVDSIMDLIHKGIDNVAIATQTGLPVTTIFEIQSGNIYKDKTVRTLLERANIYPKDLQLRNDQKEAIIRLKMDNYNYKEISRITNIDQARVKFVAQKMNYNKVLNLPGANDIVHNKKLPPRLKQRMDIYQEDYNNKMNDDCKDINDLTNEDIRYIADKLTAEYGVVDIMRMGGYSKNAVRAVRRLANKKIRDALPNFKPPRVISEAVLAMPTYKVIGICEELERGELSHEDIAEKYGVPDQSVWKIKKRRSFTEISSHYKW